MAGLKQVNVEAFIADGNSSVRPSNTFVLNENNALTHLSITDNSNIDFQGIVKNISLIELRRD